MHTLNPKRHRFQTSVLFLKLALLVATMTHVFLGYVVS
jgi:hypothetical protein